MNIKYIGIGVAAGCLLIAIILVSQVQFHPTTPDGTTITGRDYSQLTRQQVFDHLTRDFVFPIDIPVAIGSYQATISSQSFSGTIDQSQTASQVIPPVFRLNLIDWLQSHFHPQLTANNYQLIISQDDAALDAVVASISSQLDKPYVPTELQVKSGQITVKPGVLGVAVNRQQLKTDLHKYLTNYQPTSPVTADITSIGQLPTQDQIQSTIAQAQKLIGKSLSLTYEDKAITIDDATLISWLNFNHDLRADKILDYAQNTADTIKRDPVDALFKFDAATKKVSEFRPAVPGIAVDPQTLANLINTQVTQLTTATASAISAAIPLITTQPTIKNEDVNNLGIKELLGSGESTFHHSTALRNLNIKQGAAIINRILVAPGEEFSFIKNLGPVTLEAGFQKGYIIKQGHTVLDVGGGVCQVSTTLFRAMLNAGVQITDRSAHAYRVSYYEEDSKPGFDATVFIPNPDLRFINDTGHYVLIQSNYDDVNKKLTYQIYGTSDGRTVQISNYHQWDAAPPPPEKIIDDPTLPHGVMVQDEHAIPGLKTAFDWTVTRGNQIIHQKTFESNFVPWGAVFRRGV